MLRDSVVGFGLSDPAVPSGLSQDLALLLPECCCEGGQASSAAAEGAVARTSSGRAPLLALVAPPEGWAVDSGLSLDEACPGWSPSAAAWPEALPPSAVLLDMSSSLPLLPLLVGRGGMAPAAAAAPVRSPRARRTVPGSDLPFKKLRTDCMLALPKRFGVELWPLSS